MIKSEFKVESPDDIQFTLTMTMSLRFWKDVNDALCSNSYPTLKLSEQIQKMVCQATKEFYISDTQPNGGEHE